MFFFEAVVVHTIFNASAGHLLADLGRKISINTGEATETRGLIYKTFYELS